MDNIQPELLGLFDSIQVLYIVSFASPQYLFASLGWQECWNCDHQGQEATILGCQSGDPTMFENLPEHWHDGWRLFFHFKKGKHGCFLILQENRRWSALVPGVLFFLHRQFRQCGQVGCLAGSEFELQQPQCDEDLCHPADAGADCGGVPRDQPLGAKDVGLGGWNFSDVWRCYHMLSYYVIAI